MLLKKAGMVVLGAAAGVAALSGTAFAGDMPSDCDHGSDRGIEHGHHGHHGWGHDRDRDRGGDNNSINFSDDDASPTATGGNQANFGDQLIGVNNTNIQAPISAVLSVLGANNF